MIILYSIQYEKKHMNYHHVFPVIPTKPASAQKCESFSEGQYMTKNKFLVVKKEIKSQQTMQFPPTVSRSTFLATLVSSQSNAQWFMLTCVDQVAVTRPRAKGMYKVCRNLMHC